MSSTFNPWTVIVVVVAMAIAAYFAAKPGDDSAIYAVIGGFVTLYLKTAFTEKKIDQAAVKAETAVGKAEIAETKVEENKQELAVIGGEVRVIGERVDGLLTKMLAE